MIGQRIKTLREENRLSQAELAKILNCSRMTINNYETEKRIPDIDFAMNVADYFKVTVEYLSGRTEFRGKDDITISVKKAEELMRTVEKLPQIESQRMMTYLTEVLDKAQENEMAEPVIYAVNAALIQIKHMVAGYEQLQKSIVPPIIELKRRKVPESQIRLSVKDKENAIGQYSFDVVRNFTEAISYCTNEMKKELLRLVESAISEQL